VNKALIMLRPRSWDSRLKSCRDFWTPLTLCWSITSNRLKALFQTQLVPWPPSPLNLKARKCSTRHQLVSINQHPTISQWQPRRPFSPNMSTWLRMKVKSLPKPNTTNYLKVLEMKWSANSLCKRPNMKRSLRKKSKIWSQMPTSLKRHMLSISMNKHYSYSLYRSEQE